MKDAHQPRRFGFIQVMEGGSWGGSEELWSQAALRLHKDGQQVSVCVHTSQAALNPIRNLLALGVSVRSRRTCFPFPTRLFHRLFRHAGPSLGELEMVRWLETFKPDLVCISNGGCVDGLPWMELCARRRVPFVTIAQANAEWLWPADKEADRIAAAFHSAKASFFVSQANLNLFEDQIAVKLPSAVVVRNPYNVDYNASAGWPDMAGGVRLACVGRLDPGGKGQDLLLHVLAQPEWRERNVKVTLFGGGACAASVQRLTKQLNLTSVEFRGHVSDVSSIWRDHHALILPSRCEGLPLALVEAMLCSRMAIVTDVGGNTELVEDGVSGFVAAAPKQRLLAAAMERAWENRSNWQVMGQAARRQVVQHVSSDPIGDFCKNLREQVQGTL